jgi:cell division protein FtsQ
VSDPTSGLAIDPRFRRRLVEVKRDQGRRRLRVVVGAIVTAALIATGWAATRSALLDVDHVRLRGVAHTQPLQVIQTAGTLPGRPMLDLDVGAAAQRIERLPWVADAVVQRRWPNTVSIDVRERSPAASAPAAGGGWALVDTTGRVLEPAAVPDTGRPALEGFPPAGAAGTRLPAPARGALDVVRGLSPALRLRVAAVASGAGDELELRLRTGGVVRLGPRRALTSKLVAADTVLAQVDGAFAVLDVRVPERPVLTRR